MTGRTQGEYHAGPREGAGFMRFAFGAATFLTMLLASSVGYAASRPNVVYILVDNWGWGDIGVQGSTVPTPRIDALAAQGMRLTNFNVQNQCTPTRSALHTGRLPIRSGTQKVAAPGEPDGMAPWEYTLPSCYRTLATRPHSSASGI